MSFKTTRDVQDSIDKRNAAVMRLEARHRDAVLCLVTVRNYLTGEYTRPETDSLEARIDLALKAIEKCLAAERK